MARNKYPEETVKLILDQALLLFIEKGYENTSIQDIINHLGGLSKGAIYHHFKSKEDIFEAACRKIGEENTLYYDQIRNDKSKNGKEKLKEMICSIYQNPRNDAVLAMKDRILCDPKFLVNQIQEMYELVAPCYIQPIIQQGIQDGSIQTDYPKELAEALITLLNIWVNPVIAKTTGEEMRRKLECFDLILKGVGIDIFDEEMTDQCVLQWERCCR